MRIHDYMKARAASENQDYDLGVDFFTNFMKIGTRCFFGVIVDEDGNPIRDEQNPAFFVQWEQEQTVENK